MIGKRRKDEHFTRGDLLGYLPRQYSSANVPICIADEREAGRSEVHGVRRSTYIGMPGDLP